MNIREKRIFRRHIRRLDPKEEIVRIDLDRNEVRYDEAIKQYRKIRELTKEEIVRAYVVTKLITQLGYARDCIELEKEHVIGRRKKRTSARIDVLVKEPNNTYRAFMIIEVKAPDTFDKEIDEIKTQLFQMARLERGTQYLVYYTAQVSDQQIKERVISISYSIYDSYRRWENEGKPNLMGIPKEYALIKKPIFTKGGVPDLRKDVEKEELERIRKDLHNVLWGGGRYHGNEIFNFVMKLFLARIYDEKETEVGKAYEFQTFYENGESENPKKTYERVNQRYKDALKRYLGFAEDEIKNRDVRKIGDKTIDVRKVKYVVESFQDISVTENIYDVLGDFFERFLWGEFKQSKGQFFTHPNIVNFIIQGLELDKLALDFINKESRIPYIIDPACGSATFLIETMKTITNYILENKEKLKRTQSVIELVSSNFPEHRKHAWAERFIYGIDYNEDLAMASKVNMVMHGDGSGNIESEDALSSFRLFQGERLRQEKRDQTYSKNVNGQFDILISNPPFSIKLARETKEDLPNMFVYATKGGSENLFVERWYQLLKHGGRLGVVLPESVFDTQENQYIRLLLYKYFWIKAIVSLPTLAFEPYTSTRTSLLFAQKKEPDEILEYDTLWRKYEEEYENLMKDLKDLMRRKELQLGETKEVIKEEFLSKLKTLIKTEFRDEDSSLSLKELKIKYKTFIKEINKEWWIFGKVSAELNYNIYQVVAKNIGYKRTTRSERKRDNELFEMIVEDGKKRFIIDAEHPKTVLDEMRREIKWA
ncbi:MAG: N-6 DNA methylase [Candidatus Bathyarchaeota archaeon]|nr:N-6 DNA methylase [Candidatus Bathyarchaeota archaeon]